MKRKVLFTISLLYLVINLLFVFKYGARQTYVPVWGLMSLYAILLISFFICKDWLADKLKNISLVKSLYIVSAIVFLGLSIYVVLAIDENQLKVDRWSALQISVESFLHFDYPYTKADHLGQMSSNFPGLAILGLPFYLLGDVGLLQPAVFILFAFYIYRRADNKVDSLFVLILLMFSPAYLWENAAKSDLMSNVILLVIFVDWWKLKQKDDWFKQPLLLGLFAGFFLMTRGIVLVPFVLLLFKPFVQTTISSKIKFVSASLLVMLLICLPLLISIPSMEVFLKNNPLVLQTNKTHWLAYGLLLLPFLFSYTIKDYKPKLFASALLLFGIPFVGFVDTIITESWSATIYEHKYDLSYLSMCMPFLIIIRRIKEN